MVLILSLGRTGSMPQYAENIIKHLSVNHDIIVSKQSYFTHEDKESFIAWRTYTGNFSFLISTIFYFPIKLMLFIPAMYSKYNSLYLPYGHYWDLPFILLFKLFRRKVIYTVHDGILHEGENNFFAQKLEYLRISLATDLVFLTKYVKDSIPRQLIINKRVYIVPHGLLENPFIKFKKTHFAQNFLFLGRISKYKGIELLIDSIKLIKGYDLILKIAGKTLYDLEVQNEKNIHFIDKYLSDQEIGKLLTWADVLILPYKEASQSGVIPLGIFAELPMICTKVGGLNEQLEDDECIWVDAEVQSLAKGIRFALNNPNILQTLQAKMRAKKTKLNWEGIGNTIDDILR